MILFLGVASAECFEADADYLRALLDDSETYLADFRPAAFQEAMATVTEQLPCTTEAISPGLAAQLHRLKGIEAYGERDTALAHAAFAAAWSADPEYRFPETILPPSHPILDVYNGAAAHKPEPAPLPETPGAFVWIDGKDALTIDTARASLLQVFTPEGEVLSTHWLKPGDPLPPSLLILGEAPVRRDLDRPLMISTGTAAVVAGGLYAGAALTHRRYEDQDTPDSSLDTLRRRNNALLVASGSLGVVALGTGTALVLTHSF